MAVPVPADAADRALVESFLARRGEAAFLALYRRHTPALLGLASRLGGRPPREAEDLVQEAWLRAAPALSGFRWESSLRTWLSGFVVNVWREARRALPREEPAPESLPEQQAATFAAAERIDLERAVGELPDGYRAVLVLHDVEGFTHEEIAGQLAIEPGTSKSQLARARRALRARLSRRRTA